MVEMVEPMAGVLEMIKVNETVSSDSRTNGWSSGMVRQGRITNDSISGYVGWGSICTDGNGSGADGCGGQTYGLSSRKAG